MKENSIISAPWKLTGSGFILLFVANKDKMLDLHQMSLEDRKSYRGGLGVMILANYVTSNIGPYSELLFIPGDFEYAGSLYKRITKIYVSTQASVDNGKKNWGIPKELAEFDWRKHGNHYSIKVHDKVRHIADFSFSSVLFPFPMNTSIIPIPLLQHWEGKYIKTIPVAEGQARASVLNNYFLNPNVFPMLEECSIYLPVGLSIESFTMEFPVPDIL